ncbi:MAG: hypothetical protein JO048_02005 [Methylobacteriaceae bacterium]|nr:hypothetical protein [Methylobacteriaceae bacterium]
MTSLGVYAGTSPDDVARFSDWLGRPVDFATAFLNQNSWAAFDDSVYWATNLWADVSYHVNWSVPLTTWYDGNLATAALGEYNAHYRLAATEILSHSQPDGTIYIRTGWEMNGSWFPWSAAGQESAFIDAYRQFVDTFRSVSDRFAFEWTPNVGNDWSVKPQDLYPGDAYVDVIGMDFYWNTDWEGHDPIAAFNSLVDRSSGLAWQQDFAALHDKPTAISEWGVSSDQAGPYFEKVGAWFATHDVLYQSYWNYGGGDYSGKLDEGQYPEAGQAFRDTFGPVNHAPVVLAPLAVSLTEGSATAAFNLLLGASDPDAGDKPGLHASDLAYRVGDGAPQATPPAGLVFDAEQNRLVVDPANPVFLPLAAGEHQDIVVTYRIVDGHGGEVQQSLRVTVDGMSAPAPNPTSQLALRVSGDAYQGSPQFLVKVDGLVLGEAHGVSASHAAGEHEDVLIDLPDRPGEVSVVFLNDLYGGSSAADRNLYVEQISLDGHAVPGASAVNTGGWNDATTAQLFSEGEAVFHFGPVPDPVPSSSTELVLRVSGDAYQGAAQFVLKVDGVAVGDVHSVSASHAAGASEDVLVDLPARPGTLSVVFLNDLYGGSAAADRNLYVEQVSLGGHAVSGASAINTGGWNDATTAQLFSSGEAVFHFEGWWS